MRVLLLFSSSELGGAERSLTRMVRESNEGPRYDLATLDGEGPWTGWCRELGLDPHVLGERRQGSAHGRFGRRALWRLVSLVRRNRYSAVYVIGLRASIALRFLKPWLAGAKLVHGIRWNPDSESRLDRGLRLTERLFGSMVDLYICNSKIAANTLEQRVGIHPRKIRLVYNGVSQIRAPGGRVGDQEARILTVANLSPRKGHLEYLRRVVEPLHSQFPQARFVFVGRDEMAGAAQREAQRLGVGQAVQFTGFLGDVELEFARAQLFVLPSLRNEGCPTSILEAMAYGLPVVGFAIDGIPELVEDQETGLLVDPGDYAGLANAIVSLMRDRGRAARLGQAGREKVEQSYRMVHCAKRHAEIFRELTNGE